MDKTLKTALQSLIEKVKQAPNSIVDHWAYEPHYTMETNYFNASHCNYNNGGYSNHH